MSVQVKHSKNRKILHEAFTCCELIESDSSFFGCERVKSIGAPVTACGWVFESNIFGFVSGKSLSDWSAGVDTFWDGLEASFDTAGSGFSIFSSFSLGLEDRFGCELKKHL